MFKPHDTIQSSRQEYLEHVERETRRRELMALLQAATAGFLILGVAAGLLFATAPGPAQAAESSIPSPACKETAQAVFEMLNQTHETYVVLDPKSLLGQVGKDVQSIVVATLKGKISLGVVYRDGCMSAPVLVDTLIPQA